MLKLKAVRFTGCLRGVEMLMVGCGMRKKFRQNSWKREEIRCKMMEFPHFVVVLLLLIAYWSVPNILEPVIWEEPFELPKLVVNNDLIAIRHVQEGVITSPESMAMDKTTGLVYASLADGTVVALDANGQMMKQVFFTFAAINRDLTEKGYSLTYLLTHLLTLTHSLTHSLLPKRDLKKAELL